MKSVALFGAALGSLVVSAANAAPVAAQRSVFETLAMLDSAAREEDGSVWFTTWDEGARFILPATEQQFSERLWDLLVRSRQDSRSIMIHFDAAAARFNPATSSIDFPICSVEMDEIVVTPSPKCSDGPIAAQGLSSVSRIALAWAQVGEGAPVDSRPMLDEALANATLPVPLQIIALATRVDANERIAYDEEPGSDTSDRAFVAALADNRRLAKLDPDKVEYRFSEAADLLSLGDYKGANAIYDSILKEWPDETYRITVRRAALARLEGQPQHSLELLNSLVPVTPGDLGMKFYYHRGWTLMKLDRFAEAIADLTEGMKSQPEYAWAYILRGCSYAGVGQLDYAAGDFDVGAGFLQILPSARSSGG